MNNSVAPDIDFEVALSNNFTFYVCKKVKVRGSWIHIHDGLPLRDALEESIKIKREDDSIIETGVFLRKPIGGFLYWSSNTPDVFNSDILRITC